MKTYTFLSSSRGAFMIKELVHVQADSIDEAEKQVDTNHFRLLTITK